MAAKKPLRHLRIDGHTKSEKYRPPSVVVQTPPPPERDRDKHGKKLVQQLKDTENTIDAINEESERQPTGFNIALEGEMQLQNVLKSLDAARQGIELANVRTTKDGIEATVFVPQGKLSFFKKRVQDYLDEDKDSTKGVPRNAPLIACINQIGLAALQNFWTDTEPFPGLDTTAWWEVWIRASGKETGPENTFRQEARHLKLDVNPLSVRFPDRVVLLAFGLLRTFRDSFLLLDTVAEIRKAKECPTAYSHLPAAEQKAWADDLLSRISFNKKSSVSVCVLDTGLDRGNPLLKPFTDKDHVLTCFPEGNPADHDGHGTEMGGLSLFGDLAPLVAGKQPVELLHRLESVKILPATGQNHPDHYAAITEQAAYRIESVNPTATRTFCLAVTTTDFRDRGQPTAWSGALDQLAFGETADTPKRLLVVSAGNTDPTQRHQYPVSNQTDGIHDPGQSWNAITVGCYADRVHIQSPGYSRWKPVAQAGELGPASTTSLIWAKPWPLKPDFVLEGGNCALNPKEDYADTIDDLSILTTSRMALGKVFSLTGDTSAATALAARMAAVIHATYSDYWPETARALLVHSAEWTDAMRKQFPAKTKRDIEKRVKCVGFGVPSLNRALWCAGNDLTLVAQCSIQPFEAKSASQVTLRNINLHEIPWPAAELRALGGVPVTMRVTLSYFIEPSPGMRGWTQKFRYASHGLRFEVIRPLETPAKFRARLNQLAREEEEDGMFKPEGEKQPWVLGSKLRSRGSIHSDWWTGNAAALADCNLIGVFPVSGWWKERPKFERWKHDVRYTLVVSIRTPEQTVDLYTPVETRIAIPITV